MEPTRAAARRAIASVRPVRPETARRLERLLTEAEKIAAAETAAPMWRRDRERVELAWHRLAREAGTALLAVQRYRREGEEGWRELLPLAEHEVTRATAIAGSPGIRRPEAKAMAQAEAKLAFARELAAAGEFHDASAAARAALELARLPQQRWDSILARFEDRAAVAKWRRWVEETIHESHAQNRTVLVVDKLAHRLHIYSNGRRTAVLRIELGANGLLPKRHAGDAATPEGRYQVVAKKANGQTKFYKALLLNYPNAEDIVSFRRAKERGEIPRWVGAGSLIEIHGDGGMGRDWTDGCVALRNDEMDLVFERVSVGTPVTIVGTMGES